MRGFVLFVVLGFAFIGAGVFLLTRRRVLYDRVRELKTNSWKRDFSPWYARYDFPDHIKMLVFGLGLIGLGCLSIYGAFVEWFTP